MSSVRLEKLTHCTDEYWQLLCRGNAYQKESHSLFGLINEYLTKTVAGGHIMTVLDAAIASGSVSIYMVRDAQSGKPLATLSMMNERAGKFHSPAIKMLPEHLRDTFYASQLSRCDALQLECFVIAEGGVNAAQLPDVMRAFSDAIRQECESRKPELVYGYTVNPGLPAVLQKMFQRHTPNQQFHDFMTYRMRKSGIKTSGHVFMIALEPYLAFPDHHRGRG